MAAELMDDDDDDDAPAPSPAKHKAKGTSFLALRDTHEEFKMPVPPVDDDDHHVEPPHPRGGWRSMLGSVKARRKSHQQVAKEDSFIQDMADTGRMPAQYSAWKPEGSSANHHHSSQTDTMADKLVSDLDSEDGSSSLVQKSVTASSRSSDSLGEASHTSFGQRSRRPVGGWKAMMKPSTRHHADDISGSVTSLLQTPSTYTAWQPGGDKTPSSSASASLEAAKHALEDDDDDFSLMQLSSRSEMGTGAGLMMLRALYKLHTPFFDRVAAAAGPEDDSDEESDDNVDAAAESLLEDGTVHATNGNLAAAAMVLDFYADSIGSTMLRQLAHAKLSLAKLQSLWKRVQSVNGSSAHVDSKEKLATQWCKGVERGVTNAPLAAAAGRKAEASIQEAAAWHEVLNEETSARNQLLKAYTQDTQSITNLRAQLLGQFGSLAQFAAGLRQEAASLLSQGLGTPQTIAGAFESIGRLEDSVSATDAEIADIVNAATLKRGNAEQQQKAVLAQTQAKIKEVERQKAKLSVQSKKQEEASAKAAKQRAHVQTMCDWTMDEIEKRNSREQREKAAIHAALLILGSH